MKRKITVVYHTPNRTPTCEPIYETVGYNIKAWREHLEFTQKELADLVNVGRTSINNIEAGRQRVMLHIAVQIADALGIPLCDLFAEVPTCEEIGATQEPRLPLTPLACLP
jgi:DNA-binding XRE family transcriptional regulator